MPSVTKRRRETGVVDEIEREFGAFERDGVCELSSEVVIATGMR